MPRRDGGGQFVAGIQKGVAQGVFQARRHILTKKTTTQKRRLRAKSLVDHTQEHQIKAMLPYAK